FRLGPHGSASFQVMFKPDAAMTFRGSIVFSTSRMTGGTQSISGTGIGTSASSASSLLSSTASNLNFGNNLSRRSVSQTSTIMNSGRSSRDLSQTAVTGTELAARGFTGAAPLAAGQTLSIPVSFAPVTIGNATGSLTFSSSATNSPTKILLSGNGVQPQ